MRASKESKMPPTGSLDAKIGLYPRWQNNFNGYAHVFGVVPLDYTSETAGRHVMSDSGCD